MNSTKRRWAVSFVVIVICLISLGLESRQIGHYFKVDGRKSSKVPRINIVTKKVARDIGMRTPSASITPSPYAYVFMAFGCDPDDHRLEKVLDHTHDPGYRPYIANILAAAALLRRHGSQADIVAIFKLKSASRWDRIPMEETQMLQALGVKVQYLPKHQGDIWDQQERKHVLVGVLNKIHILNMTEYRRVFFLDSDVLPLTNLDYLLELSDDGGPFQETVILSTARVPMIAGFFIAAPNATLYEEVRHIVHEKIRNDGIVRKHFDTVRGWGHAIDLDSKEILWEANRDNGTHWDYHGANSDQGIFYFYPKYLRQSLTQILASKIIHYGPAGPNGTSTVVIREDIVKCVEDSPIYQYTSLVFDGTRNSAETTRSYYQPPPYSFQVPNCKRWTNEEGANPWPGCVPPYSDHAHFTNPVAKPWQQSPPSGLQLDDQDPPSALHLWWQTLFELERDIVAVNISLLLPQLLQ